MLHRWFRSLLNDELRIFVHPQYVLLTHLKRMYFTKQQIMQQQVLSVDLSDPSNLWDALKYHLADAVNSNQWRGVVKQGIRASVVVSSHFARYAVIPWSIELAVERERQAFMRYRFNALFGDTAKTWDLQMSEPDFGKPAIASGIDTKLLTALQETLTAANIKVSTISPYLMLAINQSTQQIKQQNIDSDFWFVVIESERLCFALIENGIWGVIKNVAIETDLNAQINTLIQREMVNCNVLNALPIILYQMAQEADQALTVANHPIVHIQPKGFEQTKNVHETAVNKWSEVQV